MPVDRFSEHFRSSLLNDPGSESEFTDYHRFAVHSLNVLALGFRVHVRFG
jgi:hypothetical protein